MTAQLIFGWFFYRCTSNELKPTAENGISKNSLSRKDTEKDGEHNSSLIVAGVSNDSCDDKIKLSGVDTTSEVDKCWILYSEMLHFNVVLQENNKSSMQLYVYFDVHLPISKLSS